MSAWQIAGTMAVSIAFFGADIAVANQVGPHTALRTYLDSGYPGTLLVSGNNIVSTIRVGCPRNEVTCTLALTAMDQVCNATNSVTLQVTVDGTPVDSGLVVDHGVPETCYGSTWVGDSIVGPGAHMVQLLTIETPASGIQSQWAVNYTVTTP